MKRMNPLVRPFCCLCFSTLLVIVIISITRIPQRVTPSEIQSPASGLQIEQPCEQQQKQWHANKFWHTENTFPLCTMDSCFDFARCSEEKELLIYTYGEPFELEWYMKELEGTRWQTKEAEKACIFLVQEPQHPEADRIRGKRPHPSKLPYWNGGLNHAIVTMADKWSLTSPPPNTIGNASILSSALTLTTHRPGFDISIPLPPKIRFHKLHPIKPFDRPFFLTFRGVRYLGHIEGSFRSLPSLRAMNNGADVVIAMTCNQVTNNIIRKQDPSSGLGCDDDQLLFKRHGFNSLMNSTFGLVPAGRAPSSYRMLETLSAGSIPVLVVDNYVLPFDRLIHWHRCLLQFPTSEIPRILPALRAMPTEEVERRQQECLRIYNTYFKDDQTMVRSLVAALKQRFYGMFPQFNDVDS